MDIWVSSRGAWRACYVRGVVRLSVCLVVGALGCSKADRPPRGAPPAPVAGPTGASAVTPTPPAAAPGVPKLTVDATDVKLDGASLGASPTAEQLAKLPQGAVSLAFTDDAPADRVLGLVATLHGSGRARVDLTALGAGAAKTKAKAVCAATAAPADARAVQIVLAADRRVSIGLEGALAVFSHDRATGIPLEIELGAPFFTDAPALAIAAAPASRAGELAALLEVACRQRSALRVIPVPPRPAVAIKPLCRKLVPRSAFDAGRLREAMPSLNAMDLCYRKFEPKPGPKGTVTMTFDIGPDGTLSQAAARGINPDVDRCLTWLLGTVRVAQPPAAPTGAVVTAECNTRCCNGD
jgi:hypothetical protein